eukprot:gnl/TRDRNA2_/TRDRNA2_169379_c0_seq2.p1 gnl/TRDRNA2_/TRDRNA2_169379_c0~~gnl/TRDRNA2_/TRDRNA2_169379_c0_seq2.p1  ORF type:complete len:306 (+),score=43.82 gnl/TRDRNA2_/TRDRNA2_169379_c0_seq2:3-920(+)
MRHGVVAGEASFSQEQDVWVCFDQSTFLNVVDCNDVNAGHELRRTKSDGSLRSSREIIFDVLSSLVVAEEQQPASSATAAFRADPRFRVYRWRNPAKFSSEGTSSFSHMSTRITLTLETSEPPSADKEIEVPPEVIPMEQTPGQTQEAVHYPSLWSKSKGSVLHEEGECKPCKWVHWKKGCRYGADCCYCHLEHGRNDHRNRIRPVKSARMQADLQLCEMVDACGQNPENLEQAVEQLMHSDNRAEKSYMQAIARKKIEQLKKDRLQQHGDGAARSSGQSSSSTTATPEHSPSGRLGVPSMRLSL